MHLNLTEEQEMIRDTARAFLADECPIDKIRQWEKLPEGYSKAIWAKMAEMGWTGAIYPEEYGGMGLANVDASLLMKELGRVALPSPYLSTVILSGRAILEGGNEEQKQAYLTKITAGELLVSFAVTEASTLPNAKAVKATARAEKGGFVLNGKKYFVEFAQQSDLMLVVARTKESTNPEQGLTMFLVDPKAAGVKYEKLHMLSYQPQAHVTLENVRVEEANVVGKVDAAWPVLDSVIQSGIAILCAQMTGLAERSHELAVEYSKERVQFGNPIGAFQAVQGYLATAWAKNLVGEYLGYYAAWLIDQGIPSREAVATAKAFVGYSATNSCQLSTQLHGGMGATEDARTTPFLVWAKQLQQTLGNSQYHEKIVAEEILDKDRPFLDETHSLALSNTQWGRKN
jgi:alkylation response protein AidB-like acyl-CoA dehydrogenase